MRDQSASDLAGEEIRRLAGAAAHQPRALPPAGQLFQVEVWGPDIGWVTAAWAPTRMWADDTADDWLGRRHGAWLLRQVWHEGQMVGERTRTATPAAAGPAVLDEVTTALDGLAGAARAGELDRAAAIAAVAGARRLAASLEAAELALTDAARAGGATWADLAAAIGAATRQGAQKRRADLARRVPPPAPAGGPAGDTEAAARPAAGDPAPDPAAAAFAAPPAATVPGSQLGGARPDAGSDDDPGSAADRAVAADEARRRPTDEEYSRSLRHRAVAGLGPEWTFTEDEGGHVVLWREKTTKAGGARRLAWKSGWEPQGPTLISVSGGPQPSRVKALLAAAGDFERRRRRATPAGPDVPLPAAPGWALRQTLADRDTRTWQVAAPDGAVAGTTRPSYPGARSWAATHGDPDGGYRAAVSPIASSGEAELAAGDGSDWKTRDAAAYAIAHWHDPDGTPPPVVAVMRAAADRRRRTTPLITDQMISEAAWELEKADGYEENHTWNVKIGGKRVGAVRLTWRGETSRPGWEPVDLSGQTLPVEGTGRVTAAGNAATRDAAVVALLYGLRRRQREPRKDNRAKAAGS